MTAMVGLLRGVNVGGSSRLAMADLREIVESCGVEHVTTYVQSGNVVFDTAGVGEGDVAGLIEAAIEARTGRSVPVIVRTRAEMRRVLDAEPFLDRSDDPTHHHVLFCTEPVGDRLASFDTASYAPEDLAARGSEVYLFCPNGLGRSRLANDLGKSKIGLVGTMRNWRSVTRLAAMLDEVDAT